MHARLWCHYAQLQDKDIHQQGDQFLMVEVDLNAQFSVKAICAINCIASSKSGKLNGASSSNLQRSSDDLGSRRIQ